MLHIKICGITNVDDARAAAEFGADALGFVFCDKSPRAVKPDRVKEIIASLPPFVSTVGVFVDEAIERIREIIKFTGINIVQLHGSESPDFCAGLSGRFIKAIRVKDMDDLQTLQQYKNASAFLLDTYSPEAYGGTGQAFNWDIAVEAKKFGRIILAGGLHPDNIEDAVRTVRPYAVDVSSGIEGPEKGKKDHEKLGRFIRRARYAGTMKH
jgi:phosphoribosylanthranilate isomerase